MPTPFVFRTSTSWGSCPILVIVEREVLYTAYGHHVGEVKHVRHATGSHTCTTLTQTARPSRRPRRRCRTPGLRPIPPAGTTRGYAALTSAGACDGAHWPGTRACPPRGARRKRRLRRSRRARPN